MLDRKEGEGPLGNLFDKVAQEALYGEDSWEKAESKFVTEALQLAVEKAGKKWKIWIIYCVVTCLINVQVLHLVSKISKFPIFGLFGACSTMGESMSLGAMLLDGGFAEKMFW